MIVFDTLEQWIDQGVQMMSPLLIDYEVGSVLRKIAARSVLDIDETRQRLHLFESLPIQRMHLPFLLRRAWEIGNKHGMYTVYDAAYVALADLTGNRLYTCDNALISSLGGESDMITNPLEDYHTEH